MVTIDLLKQEWKKSFRSQGFYKNLAVNIFLGLFGLYMASIFLFLGFSLDDILEKAHESMNPMELFNGALIYIIFAGLMVRFFMQQLSTINLEAYQVLPVKRSSLVNFIIIKPLFGIINYISLLIVIPFAVQSVSGYYDAPTAFRFILNFMLIIWFDSLAASFLKRKFGPKLLNFIIFILVFAGIAALEYFKIFSLFDVSKTIFNFLTTSNYGPFIVLIPALVAYAANRVYFASNFYPENFTGSGKQTQNYTTNFSFLNRFGVIGELIALEIKLILRHKRTKSILYISGFFMLYGLLFYTNDIYKDNYGFLFFIAMFMTGLLMLMFGQWIISWDSSHFDSILTKNIKVEDYLYANYYLMLFFNVLCFIFTTPYFFFGEQIIYLHLASFLFNAGVNTILLLFFATYNTRRIDLSKSNAMNYQGTTFKNFLIVIPIMFLPMLIVNGIAAIATISAALWILSALGVLGLILQKPLMNLCIRQFNRRKYALAQGFREQE